ncbi:hypothetical protein TNCT_208661 [Trichonephila clavata]|uniref:Uncharacterized protein n=1 Tax=Trichonephila clavata TaxID=2740835 RepID=A0A8X6FRH5_TRICU|nr:hypothetical protein TNCT_208661 [Trichonephila clavata]
MLMNALGLAVDTSRTRHKRLILLNAFQMTVARLKHELERFTEGRLPRIITPQGAVYGCLKCAHEALHFIFRHLSSLQVENI